MNPGSRSAGPRVRSRVSGASRSPKIALSYRRDDSLAVTGRLYDRLQAAFGRQNVFMDLDSIAAGADFREQISQTIGRTDVVIAIIGPLWTGPRADSSSRINDQGDVVRLEIASALTQQIPIIPFLVNNTPMPTPASLPPDIRELAFRNALPLDSGRDFHVHVDRLIDAISQLVGAPSEPATPQRSRLPQWQTATVIAVIAAFVTALTILGIWRAYGKKHRPVSTATSPAAVERTTPIESSPTAGVPRSPPDTGSAKVAPNELDKLLTAPSANSRRWSDPIKIPVGTRCRWESGGGKAVHVLINGTRLWDGQRDSFGDDVETLQFRSATNEPVMVIYRLVPMEH